MIIRDAVESDLPAIVEIHNAAIRSRISTAQLDPVSVEGRIEWFHEHSPTTYPLWMADQDNQLAGWISFRAFQPRSAYRGTAEISVYVHEQFRRQGIGRTLVEKALSESAGLKFHTLVGLIFGHNESSLRLFKNLGFERWALMPEIALVDGIKRDLVIVGKHA
jgi:L-amino acid N-acyltransferase YncA